MRVLSVLWKDKIGGVEKLEGEFNWPNKNTIYLRRSKFRLVDYISFYCRSFCLRAGNDVVILWSQSYLMIVLAIVLCWKKPVLIHFGQVLDQGKLVKIKFSLALLKLVAKKITIFCISDNVFSSLSVRHFNRYEVIAMSTFNKKCEFKLIDIYNDEYRSGLFYVGRIERFKNIHLVADLLKLNRSDVVHLIGPVEDDIYIKELTDRFSVIFVGSSKFPFVDAHSRKLKNFFFFPQNGEGLGLTYFEAAAAGFRIVTWWHGPIKHLCSSNQIFEDRALGTLDFLCEPDVDVYTEFSKELAAIVLSVNS